MGFQAIRVKVLVEGDALREVLDEIVQHANFYCPWRTACATHPVRDQPRTEGDIKNSSEVVAASCRTTRTARDAAPGQNRFAEFCVYPLPDQPFPAHPRGAP